MSQASATHVLVVEDDDDDFFLLARELRKVGVTQIARAADGKAALRYLEGKGEFLDRRAHPFPDLVLLDLKLPELRGEEVLRAIRAQAGWRGLPVYVQTGSDEQRDRDTVAALGAEGYFVKPLRAAQLAPLFGRAGKS